MIWGLLRVDNNDWQYIIKLEFVHDNKINGDLPLGSALF